MITTLMRFDPLLILFMQLDGFLFLLQFKLSITIVLAFQLCLLLSVLYSSLAHNSEHSEKVHLGTPPPWDVFAFRHPWNVFPRLAFGDAAVLSIWGLNPVRTLIRSLLQLFTIVSN
jgi:hypothetical protein